MVAPSQFDRSGSVARRRRQRIENESPEQDLTVDRRDLSGRLGFRQFSQEGHAFFGIVAYVGLLS